MALPSFSLDSFLISITYLSLSKNLSDVKLE